MADHVVKRTFGWPVDGAAVVADWAHADIPATCSLIPRTAIYEVINTQHSTDPDKITCEYSEVNIIAGEVPKDWFRNGITTYGHHVYVACAHVHQWEKSVFRDWTPTLNAISQTRPLNFMWLGLAEFCEEVNSYILRADCETRPFSSLSALKYRITAVRMNGALIFLSEKG